MVKSDFFKVLQTYRNGKLVPTIATAIDNRTHAQLRRPIANIFGIGTVRLLEPLVDSAIKDLVDHLGRHFVSNAVSQKRCNIDYWLQCCASFPNYPSTWFCWS